MKKSIILLAFATGVILMACKGSKSATTSTAAAANTTAVATTEKLVSTTGIFAPTEEQLTAVKSMYANATLAELTEGHKIYTGVCTKCHGAKNIYKRAESEWMHIIDDMAPKAHISAVEKDQLTKYVMSIKASQPKSAK